MKLCMKLLIQKKKKSLLSQSTSKQYVVEYKKIQRKVTTLLHALKNATLVPKISGLYSFLHFPTLHSTMHAFIYHTEFTNQIVKKK